MVDDAALLRRYAHERSQAAFEELVRRHLDLVYAAATRRLGGDSHRAADVAQVVFARLARDAGSLAQHAVLAGWLYTATRNAALNVLRSETRRRSREHEAQQMQEVFSPEGAGIEWDQLRPVLDAAMDELDERDREAVLLRFFQGRPFAEVGAAMQVSEDTARKRVERALEKLRDRLASRGITSTAAALGTTLAAQPAITVPLGLVSAVASASTGFLKVTGAAAAAPAAANYLGTIKVVGGMVVLAAAFGLAIFFNVDQVLSLSPGETAWRDHVATLQSENDRLKREVSQLKAESLASKSAAAAAAPFPTTPPVAPRVRPAIAPPGVITTEKWTDIRNNLRQIRGAARQFKIEYHRSPLSLDELVGETKYIRKITAVDNENYTNLDLSNAEAAMSVTMENGLVVTMESDDAPPAQAPFVTAQDQALARFRVATGGRSPTGSELAAYFELEDFRLEFLLKAKGLAFQQEMGVALVWEMTKAYKSFEAANGRPPTVWEEVLEAGAFLETAADRERLLEVWHRLDAQFKP